MNVRTTITRPAATRRHLLGTALLVSGGAALAACGPSGLSGAGDGSAKPATAGKSGGHLRIRLWRASDGLDPATLWGTESETIAINVYNGLVTYDTETSAFVPDLAEKWETPDGRVWKFSLRKGVQWQKGYGELTAGDVKYSYERILDPKTGSTYSSEFTGIASVAAPDDYTVQITLKEPDFGFLHKVANYHQGQVVKKEAVEKSGEQYRHNPVGTGPFQVDSWTPNAEIRLSRFDKYWKGPAALEAVTYRIITDEATAEIALLNKEIDIAGQISQPEILTRLAKEQRLQLYQRKGLAVNVMVLNATVKPLDNPLVRRAMAHAINREANLKAVSGEFIGFVDNILPSSMPVYNKDAPKYAYDPKKAKELLQQAGLSGGFGVKDIGEASPAALLVQRDLAAVGVNLEFENVTDRALSNQRRNNGQFQIAGRQTPGIDPHNLLFQYLHPDAFPPRGLNGARYSDSEVTGMFDQARREPDEKKRASLYHAIQRKAMMDLPYIPRSQSTVYWPAWLSVKGVGINMLSNVSLHTVTLDG